MSIYILIKLILLSQVLHCFTKITDNGLIDDIDLHTVIRVAQSTLFSHVQITLILKINNYILNKILQQAM